MKNLRRYSGRAGVTFAALAGAFAAVVSCSDDTNLTPSPVDAAALPDAVANPETGSDAGNDGCVSDQARCNSCAAASVDPYNACSGAVSNCVPFDPKRIPQGPGGGLPQVP